MTVKDFAKYVVDNMHRASLANALNITNKLIKTAKAEPEYDFKQFVAEVDDYVRYAVKDEKINSICGYKILIATNKCLKKFESDVKYDELMLIDSLIMDIWEACR